MLNKQRIFLVMCIGSILILLFINKINQSPYSFIKDNYYYEGSKEIVECIIESEYKKNHYIMFCSNASGNISCTILRKRGWTFEVMVTSMEVSALSDDTGDFHFSGYNKGENWVYWNVINDDRIKEILINGEKSNIIETKYNYKICYVMGEGEMDYLLPEIDIVYHQ